MGAKGAKALQSRKDRPCPAVSSTMKRPNSRGEIIKAEESTREPDRCEHPDAPTNCAGKVVSAHVLQRGNILESVAENGHVMTFRVSPSFSLKNGPGVPEPVGIRTASTFGGYCEYHDRATFADIERTAIVPTAYQALLLSYRALVSEMRSKRESAAMMRSIKLIPKGLTPTMDELAQQFELIDFAKSNELGLQELTTVRNAADHAVQAKSAEGFHFLTVELAGPPVLVASQYTTPQYGFSVRRFQNTADLTQPLFHAPLSVIPFNDNTLFVFGWHESSGPLGVELARTLRELPAVGIADALHRFVFANAEFVYFKQSWWNSVGRRQQQIIADLVGAGIERDAKPMDHLPNSCRLSNAALVSITEL